MSRTQQSSRWSVIYPLSMLIVFFVIPFAIMVGVSFFHRVDGAFYEPGFEFTHYIRFLSPFFGKVLLTSLFFSGAAAVIAVGVAFPFTWFLSQLPRKRQTVILVFLLSVLSLSEVIIGFAWSMILSRTAGIGNLFEFLGFVEQARSYTPSLVALLLGLCYLGFPYAVLVLYPAVSRLDPELPEAARMSGAAPLKAFFTVVVPLMRKPLLGALILVFVFTLGAYLLPQVLGKPQHWTLSVHITDQAIFQSNLPFAAAMAILLMLISVALVGITMLLGAEKGETS